MNCRRLEEKIYQYTELTPSERKDLEEHLNQCEACSKLARQVFYSRALIKMAASHRPEVTNPHLLTQRIIHSIDKKKSRSIPALLTDYLDSIFIRYAITVVSVFLISFFVYEQQAEDLSTSIRSTMKSESGTGAVLDYGQFRNTYVKRRDNKSSSVGSSRYSYYKSERVGKNDK
jgi:predicted anti-sigma-YlaC factor YlaD